MKALFLFLTIILLLSCEKEKTIPISEPNVVFFSSGGGYKISGTFGTIMVTRNINVPFPSCDSNGNGFYKTQLKSGKHNVTITTNTNGDVVRVITIYESGCNSFDVNNIYAWQ